MHFAGAQPGMCVSTMTFEHLPEGLHGGTLLFVTDLHFGRWFRERDMARLLLTMKAARADLLLLGGDLAENLADERAVCALLAGIRPGLGAYCVPGNNDYEAFAGDYGPFRAMLLEAGIRLLHNERAEIPVRGGRLIISGVDESKRGHPDPAVLRFPKAASDLHLLLAHSPWVLDGVIDGQNAKVDMALCGHTHGGQIVLGGLSPYAMGYERRALKSRRYFAFTGEREVEGTRVLVSNGVGMSLLPVRIGAPPQIHLIRLRQRRT